MLISIWTSKNQFLLFKIARVINDFEQEGIQIILLSEQLF